MKLKVEPFLKCIYCFYRIYLTNSQCELYVQIFFHLQFNEAKLYLYYMKKKKITENLHIKSTQQHNINILLQIKKCLFIIL